MTPNGSILEVCHYYGPYPGTFIPTLISVGRAVEEDLGLGYHCVFPASMRSRPWVRLLTESNIDCSFLEDRSSTISAVRELSRIVAAVDARLVRSHFSHWDLQASVAATRHGAAAVWHMHSERGAGSPGATVRAKDLVKARLLGRALCDRVFAVSDEIGRLAESRGIPAARVEIVLNGIDGARFATLPSRDAARAQFSLDPVTPVALGFAWSPRTKGADLLIDRLGTSELQTLLEVHCRATGLDSLRVCDDDVLQEVPRVSTTNAWRPVRFESTDRLLGEGGWGQLGHLVEDDCVAVFPRGVLRWTNEAAVPVEQPACRARPDHIRLDRVQRVVGIGAPERVGERQDEFVVGAVACWCPGYRTAKTCRPGK